MRRRKKRRMNLELAVHMTRISGGMAQFVATKNRIDAAKRMKAKETKELEEKGAKDVYKEVDSWRFKITCRYLSSTPTVILFSTQKPILEGESGVQ